MRGVYKKMITAITIYLASKWELQCEAEYEAVMLALGILLFVVCLNYAIDLDRALIGALRSIA